MPLYYRNAHAILFVYDITNSKSFASISYWYEQSNIVDEECIKIIIGNKKDLEEKRQVSTSSAKNYSNELNCSNFEISCLSNENVQNVLDTMVHLLIQNRLTCDENVNTIQL